MATKRGRLPLFVLLLIVGVLAVAEVLLPDGFGGILMPLMGFKEDTVYAPGYSLRSFRRIKVGMTKEEVTDGLGKPLKISERAGRYSSPPNLYDECWWYSVSPSSFHYRKRVIRFLNGTVVRVVSEFYVD